ncbi:RagB/SusD family nutrient uptake outer membrane protein [uncultured Pedobacter sp.]|uniref:RagB/SusD family nutrient uptake outer membrane protein n=1 Tax=uncultured Pedobacter sp. TaxID=246139 RepID=UPI0025F6D824|nr:RagB/SusD family nutrient uptake outer membrane protein [uncultured Pedobacter sp.]
MKKIFLYSLVLVMTLSVSCKKFLEEYSQDEMRPGSTADLVSLMNGDAYPNGMSIETFDVLTDDIQNNPLVPLNGAPIATYLSTLQAATPMFTFNPNMFDQNTTVGGSASVYTKLYAKVKGCNVIIDYLNNVSGTQKEKNAVLGQCLFLRSYYYLKLVTTYAQMYNGPGVNPETALGVPLVLNSQVKDGGLPRNSLKEVYDQIEKDLLQAESLLRSSFTPTTAFRVSADLCNALLSRFYLYKGRNEDMEKVIQYAGATLQNRFILTALSSFVGSNNSISANGIYNASSPEVLWVYSGSYSDINTVNFDSRSLPPFTVSAELSNQYDKGTGASNYGDLRFQYYFQSFTTSGGTKFPYRTGKNTVNATYGTKGFRVAELYLNRAEAYARRFLVGGNAADRTAALADLNTLRQSRYDNRNTVYTPVNITDAQALYAFCKEERRRELALEDGHRFIDLKRWGLGVTHVYTGPDNVTTTFTLPANSPLYALPIPYDAILANTGLIQNPG